jgi:hypothetical protein
MASASTQLSDKYLVESEMHFDNYNKISTDKAILYCIDQNTGSYTNGIVVVDTTNQLGGNNGACAVREGYLIVPYIVSLRNTDASNTVAGTNALSVCLKANVGNILDRADVSINSKPVVAGQSYSNLWNNIRLQYDTASSYSSQMAGTNLLYPDDVFASWSNSASASGDGFCNNQVNPAALLSTTATGSPYVFNSGAFKRLQENVSNTSVNTFGWPSQTATYAKGNYTNNAKSYYIPGSSAAGAVMGTWIFFIKLMLPDIHPVFETLNLVKNPQIRLTLYFNVGYNTINVANTTASFKLNSAPSFAGGSTCPVMLLSGAANNPNSGLLASASTVNVRLAWGVVNNFDVSGGSNLPFNSTRLYLPFYTLVPEIERQFLEHPIQKKVYNDCYIQQFINASSTNGATFTLTVQSTLPNIQYIAVIPFASQTIASGANFASVTGVNQFASPYDSAPFTTAFGAGLYNLQVQVGSQNLYKTLMSYDYQHFIDELNNIFSVNGGNSRDIGNGIIDQIKWTNAYKLWLFDASRVSSDVRQNVNISAQMQSDQALDYYVLVIYRRSFDLNRITCELTNQVN